MSTKLGQVHLTLATLGLVSFFLVPWLQFGVFARTGLQLAAEDHRLYLRAVPGAFVALGLAPLLPRRVLLGPAVIAGAVLLSLGVLRVLDLRGRGFDLVGPGVWMSIAVMTGLVVVAARADRLALQGRLRRGPAAYASATLLVVGGTTAFVCFGSSIVTKIRDQLEPPEDRAIRLVQSAPYGNFGSLTWSIFAKDRVNPIEEPRWTGKEVEPDVFLVSYLATVGENSGRGHFWEARLRESSVKYVNDDEFLSAKYGMTRVHENAPFDVKIGDEIVEATRNGDIVGKVGGTITNHTGKTIVAADVSIALIVVFSERKAVRVESGHGGWNSGPTATFERQISTRTPWRDGETLSFSARTQEAIEKIYRAYDAASARVEISLKVADPIDFTFDGAVKVVKLEWTSVRSLEATRKFGQVLVDALDKCSAGWPAAGTTVTFGIGLGEDGHLEQVDVGPGGLDSRWTGCIRAVFQRARFPESQGAWKFQATWTSVTRADAKKAQSGREVVAQ